MTAGAYLLLRRWRILKNLSGVITTLAAAELVIIIAHRETPRSCCCCFPDRNDDDDDCILKKSLAQIFADYYKSTQSGKRFSSFIPWVRPFYRRK
jgi:hypothetical protein